MFLPLDRKPDWKNPPLITLIILILNVLFWYIWQANDEQYRVDAVEYYFYSGLYKAEIKAYEDYKQVAETDRLTKGQIEQGSVTAQKLVVKLKDDGEFQKKLDADQIIKPGNIGYQDWRSKRNEYTYLKNRVVANQYGINPSHPSFLTYFTNMFLHGSNAHLWGNMLFLVLLGYVVEMILGHMLYLVGYLLCGLAAGWLFVVLFPNTDVSGIGASGAISGLMGMYIVLFGLRKVKFFYTLFVYFDYVKAPAIIMLPFFILYEALIPYYFSPNTNVSAHLGGFVGGLLFAGILKFIPGTINKDYLDKNLNEDHYQADYEKALQLLASMQIDEAREKFEDLLKQRPGDITIKQQLFNVSKYNPSSENYHQYAMLLLNLPGSDQTTVKIIHDTFTEYAAKAKPRPRWTPELMISLATRFAASGFMDDAEKLVNFLIKAKSDFHRNSEGLAALTKYYNGKDKQKMAHYRELLFKLYPNSDEARYLQINSPAVSD